MTSKANPTPPILHILDVGHGNSAVLVRESNVTVVDTGPGSSLVDFLEEEGLTRIDTLIISHADTDHVAGVMTVLTSTRVTIGEVVVNTDSKGTKTWLTLLVALRDAHRRNAVNFHVGLTIAAGNRFNGHGVKVEILAPDQLVAGLGPKGKDAKGRRLTSNSISAVLRISADDGPAVLLPGDIDEAGLENALEAGVDLRSLVAVYPHHGGTPGSPNLAAFATNFYGSTRCSVILFSIGRGRHSNPNPIVVSTLRKLNPKLRIGCTQLSDHCAASTPKDPPTHLTKMFAQGREMNKCCGGTFSITLGKTLSMLPNKKHAAFIQVSAPTALCR